MKTIIFYLLGFICVSTMTAQSYTIKSLIKDEIALNLSQKKIAQANYREAIPLLIPCIKPLDISLSAYPLLALCYYKIGEKEKSKATLIEGFKHGLDSVFITQYNPQLYGEEIIAICRKEYTLYHKLYVSKLKIPLQKELVQMSIDDQKFRGAARMDFDTLPNGAVIPIATARYLREKDSFLVFQKSVDSLNLIQLRNIIQKNGWPSIRETGFSGREANFNLAAIAIHIIPKESLLSHSKMMIEGAEKGKNLWGEALAFLTVVNMPMRGSKNHTLYYLKGKANGKIDWKNGLIDAYIISQLPNRYNCTITLFALEGVKNAPILLKEIKTKLVELGVYPDDIIIQEKPEKKDKNALGSYQFGFFKTSK